MLQALRDKTSGWIATVILGLLIIPFAFFGMESYMSQRVETHAARISQPPSWWTSAPRVWPLTYLWKIHDIDNGEFRQRFEMARARARDEQGDAFDAKAFESIENKRKVLDDMIDEQVMRMAAERRLRVSRTVSSSSATPGPNTFSSRYRRRLIPQCKGVCFIGIPPYPFRYGVSSIGRRLRSFPSTRIQACAAAGAVGMALISPMPFAP